jgi:hypothetical protein
MNLVKQWQRLIRGRCAGAAAAYRWPVCFIAVPEVDGHAVCVVFNRSSWNGAYCSLCFLLHLCHHGHQTTLQSKRQRLVQFTAQGLDLQTGETNSSLSSHTSKPASEAQRVLRLGNSTLQTVPGIQATTVNVSVDLLRIIAAVILLTTFGLFHAMAPSRFCCIWASSHQDETASPNYLNHTKLCLSVRRVFET